MSYAGTSAADREVARQKAKLHETNLKNVEKWREKSADSFLMLGVIVVYLILLAAFLGWLQ